METGAQDSIWYKIDRILDKIAHISSTVLLVPCVVALVGWVFLFGIFIAGRTLFDMNWQFVEEFTQYWLVMLTFFSLAYVLRAGRHINIDIVVRLLPGKIRNVLAAITNFLALATVCYLIPKAVDKLSYVYVEEIHSRFTSNILVWPTYLPIPIGLVVLALALLPQLYRSVMRLVRAEEVESKE